MKKLNKILYTMNSSIGCMMFGIAIGFMLNGYLKAALAMSLITSVIFGISYFLECDDKY
jgi:hypothetical protein